ncbi:MAG TPA: AI-2E family transporter [Enteractinococcus helveticum]|uniref:AI-2E family transporter n=1 Tax=Enteractinococcus helveticum TaxID=1837282 RepID=A0A921FK49_9MICC|nr:AI-2E family transporter [Enteractinococcus helveticum]HJF13444.1 AI-2E family transporter [Enteractinococcus helveticum]
MTTSTTSSAGDTPAERTEPQSSMSARVQEKLAADVPYGIVVAAAWSWRVLLIIVMSAVAIWLLSHVSLLVIPILIAALLATLLQPAHRFLLKLKFPPVLSSLTLTLAFVLIVVALLTLAGQQLAAGFVTMQASVSAGIRDFIALVESWGISFDALNYQELLNDLVSTLQANSGAILSGALGFGSTATNIGAGMIMALFALIFFLKDGPKIWSFLLNFVPRIHRRAVDGAGYAGWGALGSYVRVQIFVAFVDALGIGLGAWLLGVPLAMPLGVLVFLGSFVPIVGAVLTGAVAVLLALVANDWINALLMLLVVLAVQQIESNVLQPLVMGKAVNLHPLAVFLAVSAGIATLGLVGAVFAVPILAFINEFIKYLSRKPWLDDPDPEPQQKVSPPPEPAS